MAKTIKGIQTANEFSLRKKAYLDDREEFDTLADMASFDYVPDGFITLNKENGKRYEYNSSNTIDTNLGKWREYKSGGSISFDDWKEDTAYKKDTLVVKNNTLYICAIAHTSTKNFDDDLAGGNWNVYVGGSGMEHKVVTQAVYDKLLEDNEVKDDIIYIIKDSEESADFALKEDVYQKNVVTVYEVCQSTDTGALEVVADGTSPIDETTQIELSNVQISLPTAQVGDYVIGKEEVTITDKPLFVKVTEIMDTLNSKYTDRPLSAYQGYVLAQKFMKNVYITSTNVLTLEYLNGNKFTYDLTNFLQGIIKSIGYGKVIACDELPTCNKPSPTSAYEVTYKKNGVDLKCSPENTWFYYKVEEKDDGGNVTSTAWYQTLFIDGVEVTILAGAIADTIKIDENTKTWVVNGKDTEIPAQGVSPTIKENKDNTDAVYKLDINYYDATKPRVDSDGHPVYESDGKTQKIGMDVTLTTENLKGKDSVQVPLNGFYKVYVENGTLVCEVQDGATPPPLALENINGQQCLTYTIGGTIQGIKI